MVITDYDKPSVNSENYSKSVATEDFLLLEGGDNLLLENSDTISLEILDLFPTNFTGVTVSSTDYS